MISPFSVESDIGGPRVKLPDHRRLGNFSQFARVIGPLDFISPRGYGALTSSNHVANTSGARSQGTGTYRISKPVKLSADVASPEFRKCVRGQNPE
jgi:hypothetical protein